MGKLLVVLVRSGVQGLRRGLVAGVAGAVTEK